MNTRVRSTPARRRLVPTCTAALLFAASIANAQETPPAGGGKILRFEPEAAPLGGFALAPGEILEKSAWGAGVDLDYARNPLVLRVDGQRSAATVSNLAVAHVKGAVGLFGWLELGAALPIVGYLGGDDVATAGLSSQAVGDLLVRPRVRLMTQWKHGIALSIAPVFTVPLGGSSALAGDKSVTVIPEVSVSRRFGGGFLAGQASYRVRPEVAIAPGSTVGNEFGVRLGGGASITADTELLVEVDGGVALSTAGLGVLGNPMEFLGGVRHRINDTIVLNGAAGVGILSAPGTPDVRLVVGVTYGKGLRPGNGLGCDAVLTSGIERRPATGRDGDGDGIDDACDMCGTQAETVNGDRDGDGCPEFDKDQDGVDDDKDACPDLFGKTANGCPDADGDGVIDPNDQCPAEVEDMDGYQDEDGCPERDNDGDGVPDINDKCPRHPEDLDGFEDADGCEDMDNDRDGVPDADDQCPTEQETINGIDDEDGCPDKGKTLVVVKAEKIEILDKVYFATNSAVIEERSFGLLKQVALTLKAHALIELVRVEGHTDDVGGREMNLDLSQRRAESVVAFLVEQGVDKARVTPKGFAFDRPLVPNDTEAHRAENRRVEFVILDDETEAK